MTMSLESHLRSISLEAPSCTLLTMEGGQVEVQAPLLALTSPLLATLLAQAGPHSPHLSLPCTSSSLSSLLASLVEGKGGTRGDQELANILGITLLQEHNERNTKVKEKIYVPEIRDVRTKELADYKEEDTPYETCSELEITEDKIETKSASLMMKSPIQKNESKVASKNEASSFEQIDVKHFKLKEAMRSTKTFMCELCCAEFQSVYKLNGHKKKDHEESVESPEGITCSLCTKVFSNKYVLKTHMKIHTNERKENNESTVQSRALCSQCSRTFSSSLCLAKHIKSEHNGSKYTPCSLCGGQFSVFSLSKHERMCKLSEEERQIFRERRRVSCNQCEKTLNSKAKLRSHIRAIHNNEKLVECNHCGKKDFNKDNMKVHIKNVHKQKDQDLDTSYTLL